MLGTGLAGVVDAFAFLRYKVFVGIQTGNVASFQTGTVLRTTRGLADWIFERGDTSGARRIAGLGLLCLASYAIGGYVGAASEQRPIVTYVIAWALIVVMFVLALLKRQSRTS
ncbi:DUF1275 family protein [Verrucosispora sp. ts21]|uniref:DUF1275 family protein n=1 Tax=Verrucosispora sp. ts21 TaxID=2069341 RepID=UPI001E34D78A|nr:DUF1275 family protein [Verrucosispora sp. ts21]